MAAGVDIRARLGSLTKCAICLDNYDQPRCLPCLHTFCLKCLQSLCQDARPGHRKACPNCRRAFQIPARGVEALPLNFDMVALVEANQGAADLCGRHPNEAVKLYCLDCHSDICMMCFTLTHSQHHCEDAVTAAAGLRRLIDADLERLSRRFDEVRDEVARLDTAQRKYSGEMRQLEATIRQHGETVKRFVDAEVNRLVERVKAVETESMSDIRQRREKLELSMVEMESFRAFSNEVKRRHRVSEMMRSSGDLKDTVNDLLRRSVDVSQPRIEARIVFTPSHFEQVLRAAKVDQDLIGKLSDCVQLPPPAVLPAFQTARTTLDTNPAPAAAAAAAAAARPAASFKLRRKLPPGRPVRGVACLDGDLYVLRMPANNELEVYNVLDYTLERRLQVPRLRQAVDLAACSRRHCIYVADDTQCCVRRLDPLGGGPVTEWQIGETPAGISVTERDRHILVTCRDSRRLKLFGADGNLVGQVDLDADISRPCHALELGGHHTYVVCHGTESDQVSRVCVVSAEGRVLSSYGGLRGRDVGQLDFPRHLAVLPDGTVLVADFGNARVVVLSPTLGFVRELSAEFGGLDLSAYRLCVDSDRRRLYVGGLDRPTSSGRLSVFHV